MLSKEDSWYKIVSKDNEEIEILFLETNKIKKYHLITIEQIVNKFCNYGDSICLEGCYIKDFSFNELCKITDEDYAPNLFEFNARNSFFDGNVFFEGACFSGDVSFEEAVFGDGCVDFSNVRFKDGNVSFSDVKFGKGDVLFKNTEFGTGNINFVNASFNDGNVDFDSVEFGKGDIWFDYSNFGKGKKNFDRIKKGDGMTSFIFTDFGDGEVSFEAADFGDGQITFWNATFGNGNVSFVAAKLGGKTETYEIGEPYGGVLDFTEIDFGEGDVDFSYVEFGKGIVNFCRSSFTNGTLSFKESEFGDKKILFNGLKAVDGEVSFNNTSFGNGNIEFYHADLKNTIMRFEDCILNSVLSLSQSKMSKLIFSNCTNHDLISFGKQIECDISKMAFFYHNNMGTILLNWDIYKDAILGFDDSDMKEEIDGKKDNLKDKLIASELKMLKENYHNQGEYDWEDKTYVAYKRLDIKQFKKHKRVLYIFLDKVGEYGTNPRKIFMSMILTVAFFSILYYMPFTSIYPDIKKANCWSPPYYSLITFLTIGYGDLSAQNWITAALCGIEGFLGVFFMSYFSVAVVRKILR